MNPETTSAALERLVAVLETQDEARLRSELADIRAADIAEAFDLLDEEQRSRIIFALPARIAAEVVVLLDEAVRGEVVEELDTQSLSEIVAELPPDDAADVLGELTPQQADEILETIADEKSDKIEELLEYDESTAGGIMTPDLIALPASGTVADAIEHVRQAAADEELNDIYIVDAARRLIGTVPLRRLVTSPADTTLEGICDRDPVVVEVDDDQETVVQIMRKYDAMTAAVVDAQKRLVGRITHDDVLDVAEEEAEEDMLRIAGTDASELESGSVLQAARIRLTWLLPCMVGMMLTASVLGLSKPQFDIVLFGSLALFVPLIGAMGGNSGIQTTTVIVRGFATGELASTRLLRVFLREGRIALTMAPICGLLAWALSSLCLPLLESLEGQGGHASEPARIAVAVGLAMTAAILIAGVLGIALPFTFRKIGVDPAIASGPLVTTMNDVLSVTIYMGTAMLIAR